MRTLTGPEKLKVLQHIDIQSLLPFMPSEETERILWLWTQLLKINRLLSKSESELTSDDITNFDHQAREWVRKFTDVYHSNNVTPYIHAMANHVSDDTWKHY